jgi:hypothetical protein
MYSNIYIFFFFFFFLAEPGFLNSGLHTYTANALPLEPHLQPHILIIQNSMSEFYHTELLGGGIGNVGYH